MHGTALFGATGRMGRAILPLLARSDELSLTGALASAGNPAVGKDAGELAGLSRLGVPVTDDPERALTDARVALDFTRAGASVSHARACARHGVPIVIGTTGHDGAARGELGELARSVAILLAPNMSVGVNLAFRLLALMARALGDDYDVEITEIHHRMKKDAPSGTAQRMAATGSRKKTSASPSPAGTHNRSPAASARRASPCS